MAPQQSPAKNWFDAHFSLMLTFIHRTVTWNNYPEDWEEKLKGVDLIKYAVVGKEVAPQTQTPHLQMYIQVRQQWCHNEHIADEEAETDSSEGSSDSCWSPGPSSGEGAWDTDSESELLQERRRLDRVGTEHRKRTKERCVGSQRQCS